MKEVKQIDVKVSYRVCLHDIKVPNIVLEQLLKIQDQCFEFDPFHTDYSEAAEWLRNHIDEDDLYNLEYEISDIQEK